MTNKLLLTVFLALLALTAGLLVRQATNSPQESQQAVKLIEFSFPDISDQMQSVSQWQGKLLVVNFWASWCGPCLEEIPEFIKLQAEYQHRGLQFVGIAIEDKAAVAAYLQKININYPVLIAGDAGISLAQQFGNIINAVPFTIIVNQAGLVVHRQPGGLSRRELLDILDPLLAVK